jgi:GT2 family glycosyltransferase
VKIGIGLVTHTYGPWALFESVARSAHDVTWYIHHHSDNAEIEAIVDDFAVDYRVQFVPHRVNRGLARSWNECLRSSADERNDLFLLLNDDLHFRDDGFDQFVDFAEGRQHDNALVFVTGFEPRTNLTRPQGFACCAIAPQAVASIGYLDENFFPAYCEDIDYMRRITLAGLQMATDERVLVEHVRNATTLANPDLRGANKASREYFVRKWGGTPEQPVYAHPFDKVSLSLRIGWAERADPYPGL